jgi:hypothetical protein
LVDGSAALWLEPAFHLLRNEFIAKSMDLSKSVYPISTLLIAQSRINPTCMDASGDLTQSGWKMLLALRPAKLSRCDAEHLTEVTRQVALVGKPYGIRNLRQ